MTIAFLASPMDFAIDDTPGRGGVPVMLDVWRQQVRHRLAKVGVMTYDPSAAWSGTVGTELDPRIEKVNRVAMGRADILFALLPPGIASIGVPMEIERAMLNSIPVYVAGGRGSQALSAYTTWEGFTWSQDGDIDALVEMVRVDIEKGRYTRRHPGPDVLPVLDVTEHQRGFIMDLMPRRAHQGDAGFDLYVAEPVTIAPGESADVPMGVAIELPDECWALLISRSSTRRTRNLDVLTAVIDSGWRGPLFAYVTNLGDEPVEIQARDRLAQLIPISLRSHLLRPEWASELRPSDRGERGFGSTGR